MIPIVRGIENLTGKKFGRFVVMGLYQSEPRGGSQGRKNIWLVRCACGDYESRTTKAVKNPSNKEDRCLECRHTLKLKKQDLFRTAGTSEGAE
jgi:hypothetical protein